MRRDYFQPGWLTQQKSRHGLPQIIGDERGGMRRRIGRLREKVTTGAYFECKIPDNDSDG